MSTVALRLAGTDANARRTLAVVSRHVLWICMLGLFSQLLIHYYYIISVAARQSEQSMVYNRVFPALAILFATLVVMSRYGPSFYSRLTKVWRRLFFGCFLVGLTGLAVGVASGSAFRYLLSDTFRYGLAWWTLFLCMAAAGNLATLGHEKTLQRLIDALACLAVLDALATLYIYKQFPWFKISTSAYFFLFGWGLFQTRRPRWVGMVLFGLGVLTLLLSGKRGGLVVIVALSPIILMYQTRNFRVFAANAAVAALVLFGGLLLIDSLSSESFAVTEIGQRITRLVESTDNALFREKTDQSLDGRSRELNNIWLHYAKNGLMIIGGCGFGAEVEMVHHTGIYTASGKMHQVHIAWGAYFLRNGIMGVCLLMAFCLVTTIPLLRACWSSHRSDLPCLATYIGLMLLMSLKSQIMLEQLMLPMIIGLSCGFLHLARSSRTATRFSSPDASTQSPAASVIQNVRLHTKRRQGKRGGRRPTSPSLRSQENRHR